MLPSIPCPQHYDVSPHTGFLPEEPPLEILPDPYYQKWEAVVKHLQALLLSKRLREVVQDLPVITTSRLRTPAEWRRAYVLLAFMAHAYIWAGDKPEERVPPPISIPFLQVCRHLELPTVATYAGVCLWNWKPIFDDEPTDQLSNLATLHTFTGSLDESWFYLISVAIEGRAGPLIPLLLQAIEAARESDNHTVTSSLRILAERLDELGAILQRMYENNDPHVFYHRIRPFLSGSKNMADAGLPNGVVFDTGSGRDPYVQYGGGSNAQSSLIQFFDIILGVEHRPTGVKPPHAHSHHHPKFHLPTPPSSFNGDSSSDEHAPPPSNNFIHEMRNYMPGPHRRFLAHLTSVVNIRPFVESNRSDVALTVAYDAALAMLRSLRDKHMQMVSRYIVVKSHESKNHERALSPRRAPNVMPSLNSGAKECATHPLKRPGLGERKLTGTGGTALIPFLKQARDETGEMAIGDWFKRTMRGREGKAYGVTSRATHATTATTPVPGTFGADGASDARDEGEVHVVGLSGVWRMDEYEGGICHW